MAKSNGLSTMEIDEEKQIGPKFQINGEFYPYLILKPMPETEIDFISSFFTRTLLRSMFRVVDLNCSYLSAVLWIARPFVSIGLKY